MLITLKWNGEKDKKYLSVLFFFFFSTGKISRNLRKAVSGVKQFDSSGFAYERV